MKIATEGPRRLGSLTLAAATALTAVLLVVLALLQYRWVGQVSLAERERIKRSLQISADRITDDFDREVFRAFVAFQPHRQHEETLADRLADGWERWRASALEPDMVEAVYVAGPEAEAIGSADSLARLDPTSRELRPAEWPPELAPLDLGPRSETGRRSFAPGSARRPLEPVLSSAPALLLPIWPSPRDRGRGAAVGPREPSFVLVLLDRQVLATAVLPTLVDLHLGSEPRDTHAWVVDRSRRDETLYTTTPGAGPPQQMPSDSVVRTLLDVRLFPELRAQGFQRFFDDSDSRRQLGGTPWSDAIPDAERWRGRPGPDARLRLPRTSAGDRVASEFRERIAGPDEHRAWALILVPAEGSLDAAVARLRRRNLGVGLAVIALLGATSALLLLSARRAQSLARREMELIAGITHELRTPLASIASAADNLADGVVREQEQIRRYGGLIKGETHRLGALVAQVLDFAGSAATSRRARPVEPVDLGPIVDRVIEDHRFTIDEKGFTIDRRQSALAARALAEPDALRRALDNVIGNALKYGDAGRWLGIEIAPAPAGGDGRPRVMLRVRDRGPGIARSDRRRVFEPFYRGPGAAGLHLHGTGLGLAVTKSVVESLGGSIEIEDGDAGRGATFVITLLAAPLESAPDGAPIESAPQTAPRTASP